MRGGSIVWVRSLLAVYRQAAVDATREDAPPASRQRLIEDLAQVHTRFAAHEDLESLWREGFGGTEEGVREALLPLAEAALACDPESPMRALIEFAAEEVAFLFDEG